MKNKKDNQYIGKFLEKDYTQFKDGILELLDDYKRKSERLDKIIKQSDKFQLQLLKANEELDIYKNDLEKKVQEEIEKREEKEKMLLEQSKFAAMGEMIDAIAHQWAQPLNILNMYNQTLLYDFEAEKIDKEYIENFQKKVFSTIEHMNSTLNDFRTFFRPNKEIENFCLLDCIKNVCLFVKDEFIKEQINISLNIPSDISVFAIEAEFKHIILNIINNSKDAFIQNKIKNRQINIEAFNKENLIFIEISDNAGGISEEIIDKVFDANFTTKEDKGSGAGLYMSSLIAQKNHIDLEVKNIDEGVLFILRKEILL